MQFAPAHQPPAQAFYVSSSPQPVAVYSPPTLIVHQQASYQVQPIFQQQHPPQPVYASQPVYHPQPPPQHAPPLGVPMQPAPRVFVVHPNRPPKVDESNCCAVQ